MSVQIKFRFGQDLRRLSVASNVTWKELHDRIAALIMLSDFNVTYIDEDGDNVTIGTDEELQDLLSCNQKFILNISARGVLPSSASEPTSLEPVQGSLLSVNSIHNSPQLSLSVFHHPPVSATASDVPNSSISLVNESPAPVVSPALELSTSSADPSHFITTQNPLVAVPPALNSSDASLTTTEIGEFIAVLSKSMLDTGTTASNDSVKSNTNTPTDNSYGVNNDTITNNTTNVGQQKLETLTSSTAPTIVSSSSSSSSTTSQTG